MYRFCNYSLSCIKHNNKKRNLSVHYCKSLSFLFYLSISFWVCHLSLINSLYNPESVSWWGSHSVRNLSACIYLYYHIILYAFAFQPRRVWFIAMIAFYGGKVTCTLPSCVLLPNQCLNIYRKCQIPNNLPNPPSWHLEKTKNLIPKRESVLNGGTLISAMSAIWMR